MKSIVKVALALSFFSTLCVASNVAIPGRLIIKHFEADGVGFNGGYSTVEAMMAVPTSNRHIPFADLRYHVFNRGRSALNGGLGYRYNIAGSGLLFGMNAYYDARWTTGQTFSQFGGGLELLSRFIDFRFNGYFPVKRSYEILSNKFLGFTGNNIIVKERKRLALTGGNGEAGFYFAHLGDLKMYLAGGAYYFKRQQCDTNWGKRGRLRFSWRDNIWAEFAMQKDDLYKTNYQGQVSFQIPFWKKPRNHTWSYFPNFEAMMIQPPVRDEILVLCDVNIFKPARGPDGNIIEVFFVDNTSNSDGTFESPFPTLLQAQNASGPGNFIYVYPGDGTTMGMDAGIALQQDQRFFGTGFEQIIRTSSGILPIPALTSGTPTITNLAGSAITLSANNVVRGFNIASPTMRGIVGTNPATAIIDHVTITGAMTNGVELSTTGGNSSQLSLTNSSISASGMNGAQLTASSSSTLDASVTSNVFNSNTGNGFAYTNASSAKGTVTFTNNTLSGNTTDGVDFVGGGENLTATISNNTINNSGMSAIDVTSSATAIVNATINNNIINTAAVGIDIVSNTSTTITASLDSNTVSMTSSNAIIFDNSLGGTANVTATNNTISSNAGRGFYLLSGSSGVLTPTINDNTINRINAFSLAANSTINISSFANNVINATGGSGIFIDGSGSGATLTGTFSGNTITGSDLVVQVGGSDSRNYTLTFSNNTLQSTANTNFVAIASDTAIYNLTLTGNMITNSAFSGFRIVGDDTSSVTLSASGNTVSNGNIAFEFEGNQTGGVGNTVTITNNTFSNNTGRGIAVLTTNASTNTFTVTNNTLTSNSTEIKTEDTSSACLTFTGNTSNNNDYSIIEVAPSTLNVVSSSGDASAVQSANTGSGANPITFTGVNFTASCP